MSHLAAVHATITDPQQAKYGRSGHDHPPTRRPTRHATRGLRTLPPRQRGRTAPFPRPQPLRATLSGFCAFRATQTQSDAPGRQDHAPGRQGARTTRQGARAPGQNAPRPIAPASNTHGASRSSERQGSGTERTASNRTLAPRRQGASRNRTATAESTPARPNAHSEPTCSATRTLTHTANGPPEAWTTDVNRPLPPGAS